VLSNVTEENFLIAADFHPMMDAGGSAANFPHQFSAVNVVAPEFAAVQPSAPGLNRHQLNVVDKRS